MHAHSRGWIVRQHGCFVTEALRIGTWNAKHAAPANGYLGRLNLFHEACKALAGLELDLLAIQEVDRHVWRSGFADLVRIAASATGLQPHFGKAMGMNLGSLINPLGEYGNLLLVRGQVTRAAGIRLDGDYKRLRFGDRRPLELLPEPRQAISATVRVKGHEIAVVATHLGGRRRFLQLTDLANSLAGRPEPRKVLLGDFNMLEPRVGQCLANSGLVLAGGGPYTNPAPVATRSIDHVAVGAMQVLRVNAELLPVSDHLARIVEVCLRSNP